MEFLPALPTQQPKHLYPCLAAITISAPSASGRRASGSALATSDSADDSNPLTRIISGSRRKTSFGDAAGAPPPEVRRRSFTSGKGDVEGTWYWRVQVGVTAVSSLREVVASRG